MNEDNRFTLDNMRFSEGRYIWKRYDFEEVDITHTLVPWHCRDGHLFYMTPADAMRLYQTHSPCPVCRYGLKNGRIFAFCRKSGELRCFDTERFRGPEDVNRRVCR